MNLLQFRILFRHFLFRVIDLDLIAPHGDIRTLLGQFAALLLFLSSGFALASLSSVGTSRFRTAGTFWCFFLYRLARRHGSWPKSRLAR